MNKLKYLSVPCVQRLSSSIEENIGHYRNNGFVDFLSEPGWNLEKDLEVDLTYLELLDISSKNADIDAKNSALVWKALHNLTPALATENRVWSRLSHIEAFEYSKARWVNLDKDDDSLVKIIQLHFFAPSLTGYRDDHSISRLWWNAYVAKLLRPNNFESALDLICKKADIRQALMERSMSFSRRCVGRAILRAMEISPEICSVEDNFREFMKSVNLLGGGMLFEMLSDKDIDSFMAKCWDHAQSQL